MPVFQRRPLALLICCLFANTQVTQAAVDTEKAVAPLAGSSTKNEPPLIAAPDLVSLQLAASEVSLNLKVERKMLSIVPKGLGASKPEAAPPTFIIADQIEGRNDEETVAEGNVEMRKIDSQLLTDKLTYWPLEDEMDAVGNVQLYQYEDEIRGPHLRMKMSQQIGYFDEADFKLKRDITNRFYRPVTSVNVIGSTTTVTNAPMMMTIPSGYGLTPALPIRRPTEAYGHAKRIDFEGENQVRLSETTYSSCKPGQTDWYLRASEIKLDYDQEAADGKNATVYFKGLPIFYAPFASFGLNQQRHSGFLPPMYSASTKNGIDLTLPYYWNLAPNYDVTFLPREMAKRGFQLGAEARYVDHNYSGTSRLEYLPNDSMAKRSRWAYGLTHEQTLGRGLSASINLNGVSDSLYWSDLSSRLLDTSQSQLPKQVTLNYVPPASWWSASATWLRYQTLQLDPANPTTRPYFLEPQINFYGRLPNVLHSDISLVGQYSRFSHPTLVDGSRAVLYPQLSVPFVHPAFSITPKIGVHATQYNLDRVTLGQPSRISRVLPIFSVDSNVVFERDTKWLGRDHIQTLEPRLYYVYIPYRDQNRIPVFDSGVADFNFAQIFTENRYSGYDRINDANQLTAAVTTRYLDANTGAERFKFMVGQRYYLRNTRVLLPGETPPNKNFSNSLFAFNGLVLPKTYVDSAVEYNNKQARTERFSIGARYQSDHAKVLSASYRFVRSDVSGTNTQVDQIDLATQWPLNGRWSAVGRYNYSIRDKQILEAVGGAEYNAGCWSARFVVQRLKAVAGTPNTTFFFQLELNDFASIGSNPLQLLRRSIPGYAKTNEMPNTGSLLTSE